MANTLPPVVVGDRKRSYVITWTDDANPPVAVDLTGATLTGEYKNMVTGTETAITGTLALVTAASGIFSWARSAADVATAGVYRVRFVATYSGPLDTKSFAVDWLVKDEFDA